jgi:hypothetical protein
MLQASNGSTKSTQFQQDLLRFPPKLRKLAQFIAESKEFMSLSKYFKAAGMSPNTTISMICKARKNGNDFNELLREVCKDKLMAYRPQVMQAPGREALKGSQRHQELYFRLCGDLHHEKIDPNINIKSLTYVLAMPETLNKALKPAPQESIIEVDIVPNTEEISELEHDLPSDSE